MSGGGTLRAALLAALALLGACGQTGALYLPDQQAAVEVRSAAATEDPPDEPPDDKEPTVPEQGRTNK